MPFASPKPRLPKNACTTTTLTGKFFHSQSPMQRAGDSQTHYPRSTGTEQKNLAPNISWITETARENGYGIYLFCKLGYFLSLKFFSLGNFVNKKFRMHYGMT